MKIEKTGMDNEVRPALRDVMEIRRCSNGSNGSVGERLHAIAIRGTARVARTVRSGLSGFAFFTVMLLQLSTLATGMMNLTWNPNTNSNVAGYNIYYGGASRDYTNEVPVGRATNATISGLATGLTYYFAATTYTSSGVEGPFSSQVSYIVPIQAVLSAQINRSNGVPDSLSIIANGMIPNQWALQSSPDLKTWITIAQGTNLAVNILVPVDLPMQFFRLTSQ